MDLLDGDVELTEFEAMDVESIKGVGQGANGFPILVMKGIPGPAAKDWADWDAAHEGGGGKGGKKDDSKADAAAAVARAKQTIADHKAGKKVSAADLKNAHDVHEAHLAHVAHEEKLKSAEADAAGRGKPAAKKGAAEAEFDREGALAAVKAIVGRKVDESPDIAGGTAVLAQIADLIIAEAQELKAGQAGEIRDIQQLACAAEMIWCWRTGEESVAAGSVMPATALMQSAAESAIKAAELGIISLNDAAGIILKDRNYSAAERKEMAGDGRALSDGSYPINDEHDLNSAAILARSGHGDAEAAKKHIGKRAKELGVKNPLDDGKQDASKSEIAPEGADVDTVTKGTGDLAKVVADAVTKALQPHKERVTALEAELAKVKAAPVPGGPVLSRNVQVKQPGAVVREDWAAKAAYYREMAEQVTDRPTADGYRKLAREADEKAVTPTS